MQKYAKTIAIASPILAIASFFTLGNEIVIKNETVNSIGLSVTLFSVVAFLASIIVLVIARAKNAPNAPVINLSKDRLGSKPADEVKRSPRWYVLTKFGTGFLILFGLYVVLPIYLGVGISGRLNGTLFLFYLTIMLLLLMFPFGIFVWPLTIIGFGLIIFHRKQWIALDIIGIVLATLIISAGFAVFSNSQKNEPPIVVESIAGTEIVHIITTNGEGGRTKFVGLCITSRIQVPRDDAPDMICSGTDQNGEGTFEVKPGKYYIYFDLRTRDEYDFDPKFPHEYIEIEVLPQSTNEIEFMVTTK